jgi:CO/xanthine dehydrogenase FAD-binding subunit
MNRYAQPATLAEALALRAERGWTVLAGGTDFYPARVDRPVNESVLDISRVSGLKTIEERADHFRIGALVTWTQLLAAPLPACFDTLKMASREVGGIQIQNRGTVVGNVCNASPAADGIPALLALNAQVEVQSHTLPAAQIDLFSFIISAKKTLLSSDALVTALIIPKPTHSVRSAFLKTGARTYLLISTAMVAAVIEHEKERVVHARVAVGSCTAVAQRLPHLEVRLQGQLLDRNLSSKIQREDFSALTPIDDVRATAQYRLDCAMTLTQRVLDHIVEHRT